MNYGLYPKLKRNKITREQSRHTMRFEAAITGSKREYGIDASLLFYGNLSASLSYILSGISYVPHSHNIIKLS